MPRIVGIVIEFGNGTKVTLHENGWSHVEGSTPVELGTYNTNWLKGKSLNDYEVVAREKNRRTK